MLKFYENRTNDTFNQEMNIAYALTSTDFYFVSISFKRIVSPETGISYDDCYWPKSSPSNSHNQADLSMT